MISVDSLLKQHDVRPGRTLVSGSKIYEGRSDRRDLYGNAIGVDMLEGDGVDHVHNLEARLPGELGKFDHVDCCSVLEHSSRPWEVASTLQECLVEEGTMLLSVPFIWRVHAYPNDYWRFTPEALDVLFPQIRWLEKTLLSSGRKVKRQPAMNDRWGNRWLCRTEVIAFGVKCTSSS
ncbi:MAG: hypothetical protein Q8L20_10765 [Gammaproteobacteria bacterium]|nr:hypothetical protein [Gammaproteobacteria bacterium]